MSKKLINITLFILQFKYYFPKSIYNKLITNCRVKRISKKVLLS